MKSWHSLEPVFNMVQHVHRYGVDHSCFFAVVFVYKHHVKVLQMELYTLKMDQFYLVQRHHKRGL